MFPPRGPLARILAASLVGTAVEFYDFYVYATAASLVLGPLFFPASSASAQLLASYGSFALAFIARPLGAVVFGHFGDRIGRKSTLVVSLLTMGFSTFAIGLLPGYVAIGWFAPFLLCVLRFWQGFGLGGEWGGAALLAIENAPLGYRARFGMVPQLGAPVGFIAANGLFLLLGYCLSAKDFEDWGWRLPFLASAILVGLGLWVRLRLAETPVFAAALAKKPPARVPLLRVLRDQPLEVLTATLAVVACFAIFYLTTAFALGYGTSTLHIDRRVFLSLLLAAILFLAIGIIAAGVFADRYGARPVLAIGCLATIGLGGLLAPALGSGSLATIWLFLSAALFIMGFVYGPLGAFLPSLFPPHVRYTGASIGFNLGGIIGGGLTPLMAQTLAGRGGLGPVGLFLAAAALLSFIGVLLAPRPAQDGWDAAPGADQPGAGDDPRGGVHQLHL